jgi:hypothetical protein
MKVSRILFTINIIAICFAIFILYITNCRIRYISYTPILIEYDSTNTDIYI